MKVRSRRSNIWVYALVGGLSLLVVLLTVGVQLWYRLATEPKTVTLLTRAAVENQWLAMEALGNNYGVTVHSDWTIDVDQMPPSTNTIVLEDLRSAVPDATVSSSLENWVLGGGTLIYRLPIVYFTQDPLETLDTQHFPANLMVYERRTLRMFDVVERLFRTREKISCETTREEPVRLRDGAVANLEFPQSFLDAGISALSDGAIDIRDVPEAQLLDTSLSPYANDLQILAPNRIMLLPYGRGTVYLVTELYQWSNHYIDCADNAYVFLHFLNSTVDLIPGLMHELSVWIVPRVPVNTPNLIELAWSYYYVPIIGFLCTFFLAWIAHNIRSRPPMHAVPVPRRATIDYVTRVTEFAWRRREIGSYLRALSWVSANPKGVFGPQSTINDGQQKVSAKTDESRPHPEKFPTNEEDLVVSVRNLQTQLKANMQPSLRTTKTE